MIHNITILQDNYTFKFEKIYKSNIHLATRIFDVECNQEKVRVLTLDDSVLAAFFKEVDFFKTNKHHYLPRFILKNWQTNVTTNKKEIEANSYYFNFEEGIIENRSLNIYENMQSLQYYNKIVSDHSGVESIYTLEGGFINNLPEKHIQNVLTRGDINLLNTTNIIHNDFYELLSSIYYINNRGSKSFFNEIFNLILTSQDFINDYKDFVKKKFESFYQDSMFNQNNFFIDIVNFDDNFLFINDFWGVLYGLTNNGSFHEMVHLIPLKQNKAIIISNVTNIKYHIIKYKKFIQELTIRDTMYLAQKRNTDSVILVGFNDDIVSFYINKCCEAKNIKLGNLKSSKQYKGSILSIKHQNYKFASAGKYYLSQPYEIDQDTILYLATTYRGLFKNKIINPDLGGDSIEIESFYNDKFSEIFLIIDCYNS